MKSIEIDRTKHLREQPHKGHNRWHPDVPPILEADEGEEVVLDTFDGLGGRVNQVTTVADMMERYDPNALHPMTGPVYVKGAQPGDLLEVEYLDIIPQDWAFTVIIPGLGFLRDDFTDLYLAHWDLADGWATSPHLPNVRIPGAPFTGIAGVAPSHEQVRRWAERERAAAERGAIALPPEPTGAIPSGGAAAAEGLRTIPPRENGGNMDMKHMTRGSRLFLPVFVEGALFSAGDSHFAQGDGEVCVTAIEMGATAAVRFRLHKGEAERRNIGWPYMRHESYAPGPCRFTAAMGMPVREDGYNDAENLTLAAQNALRTLIAMLQERGYSREQAYVICSVAADLHVSAAVDVPNVLVSALLPDDIFVD